MYILKPQVIVRTHKWDKFPYVPYEEALPWIKL